MEEQIGTGMGIVAGQLVLAVFGGIVGWIASLLIKGSALRAARSQPPIPQASHEGCLRGLSSHKD